MKMKLRREIIAIVMTAFIVASAILSGVGKVEVQAATKKVTTKAQNEKQFKKAPAVKKGTTVVSLSGGYGLVKFTATKTKTYTFTFKGVKDKKSSKYDAYGSFSMSKVSGKKFKDLKVTTNGGKTDIITVVNKVANKGYNPEEDDLIDRRLTSRYAKIKLKKGETVAIFALISSNKGGEKDNMAYTVNIK